MQQGLDSAPTPRLSAIWPWEGYRISVSPFVKQDLDLCPKIAPKLHSRWFLVSSHGVRVTLVARLFLVIHRPLNKLWGRHYCYPWRTQAVQWLNPPAHGGGKRFHPWVRRILWGRKWQTTLVFLPGESHGQRSLAGYMGSQSQTRLSGWAGMHIWQIRKRGQEQTFLEASSLGLPEQMARCVAGAPLRYWRIQRWIWKTERPSQRVLREESVIAL